MKKIILIFIFTLLLSCQKSTSSDFTIDLIAKGDTPFWNSLYDGAKSAAIMYNINVNLLTPQSEADFLEQTEIILESVESNPDAILLASSDFLQNQDAIDSIIKADIPLHFVDSATEHDDFLSFTSSNNYQIGIDLANEFIKRVPSGGEILVVNYMKSSSSSIDREQGFLDTIGLYNNYNVVDILYCDSDYDLAEKLTKNSLEINPDISVVIGLNEQSTVGAARAIISLNSDIFLAGVDCSIAEADLINDDILNFTILQNPYLMGYTAVKSIVDPDESKGKIHYIPTYTVDKSNIFSDEISRIIFPFD